MPGDVKLCAVSLGAGSPLKGAEVREEVTSGPPVLPGRESARGQQHGGKAWSIAEASKMLPRKARVIWRSCAARRSVLFLTQSGRTRRDVLESDGLPQPER